METRPNEATGNGRAHSFITHKELAAAYKVDSRTFVKELELIAERVGWKRKPNQRKYTPLEQEKIFSQLGNPFA